MKILLTISLSIVLGFLLAVLVLEPRHAAIVGAAGDCVAKKGDVNADGETDMSDAITILGHLFLGNPIELPEFCAPAAAGAGLPATGQTACYDFDLNQGLTVEVPCGESTCVGQDGFHAKGCPTENRFVDNGDGTVTDKCTGLMWQQATADINGDGQIEAPADTLVWCDALNFCDNLNFAGHGDWRLPNIVELQSIVDYGRFEQSIYPVFSALSEYYWSSTTMAATPDNAWGIGFNNGYVGVRVNFGDFDFSFNYVRAVRNLP